jgi:succinate dehydrogenase hydrophobic anchor subunit
LDWQRRLTLFTGVFVLLLAVYGVVIFTTTFTQYLSFRDVEAACHSFDFIIQDLLLLFALIGFSYAAKVITDVIKSEM